MQYEYQTTDPDEVGHPGEVDQDNSDNMMENHLIEILKIYNRFIFYFKTMPQHYNTRIYLPCGKFTVSAPSQSGMKTEASSVSVTSIL